VIPGRDAPVAMLLGLGLTACVAGVLVSLEGTAQAAPVPPPTPGKAPPAPAIPAGPPGPPPSPLALAALEKAHEDLAAGIHEQGGNNRGPEIEALYLKPLGLPPGSQWCAAALWSWVRRGAAALGVAVPDVPQTGRARAPIAWFKARGLWVPATPGMRVQPGWIAIWDRSINGRPETSGNGHTGITNSVDIDGSFATIEGNSGPDGDRVDAKFRPLADVRLLGFGRLP